MYRPGKAGSEALVWAFTFMRVQISGGKRTVGRRDEVESAVAEVKVSHLNGAIKEIQLMLGPSVD